MGFFRDLDPGQPTDASLQRDGDDELRAIKQALWDQWPNFSAQACTPSVLEVNTLAGINVGQSIQQQIDALASFVGWGGWKHSDPGIQTDLGTISTTYKDIISTSTVELEDNTGVIISGVTGGITPTQTPTKRVVLHCALTLISTGAADGVLQFAFRNSGTVNPTVLPGVEVDRTFSQDERRMVSFTSPAVAQSGTWFVAMRSLGGDLTGVRLTNGAFWLEYA